MPTSTPTTTGPALGVGTFGAAPRFDPTGRALVVFTGGSVDQLMAAAAAGATGAWVQDGNGVFQLLVVNGPAFLSDAFRAAFPRGIPASTAVLLTR